MVAHLQALSARDPLAVCGAYRGSTTTSASEPALSLTASPDGATVTLSGVLDRRTIPDVHTQLMDALARRARGNLGIDLQGIEKIDSAGVAMLGTLVRRAGELRARLSLVAVSDAARDAMALFPMDVDTEIAPVRPGLLEFLGGVTHDHWVGMKGLMVLSADTFIGCFAGAPRTRRVRRGATWTEAVRVGVDALPIVGLISFLIGVVVALLSAAQLRQFGASRLVADLISVSMTREMGPLITAIIVAGRSGAAIAAEVATMQVSQEVDALATMGLSPVRYIVVPKFMALTMMLPCLTIMSSLLGIVGGFVVSWLYLDLAAPVFWSSAVDAVVFQDVMMGFGKSVVFAWAIVLLAAHRGFQARGGAESVGRVTTTSVVSSIFWVIVIDAVFSLLFFFDG